MMKKNINIITALTISIMLLAGNGFADIPAPPVNQSVGMPDGIFNDMLEAECRACHDDPEFGGPSNSDRHHLLYGSPIIYGECSVNRNTCLTDSDCNPNICENYGTACSADTDCYVKNGETCGEICVGETAASDPLANEDIYVCLSCHTLPDDDTFFVESDCLVCHYQVPGEASVHHLTATAQGTDSPLGDPTRGDCTPCHGTLVDDYGDGHTIPTYEPTEQTPSVKNGTGLPLNSEGNEAGACNYCHTTGTNSSAPGTDAATGILVYSNTTTHHSSGVYRSRTGAINTNNCSLCHGDSHLVLNIRTCEQCHGYESLHSIQTDSNGDGEIVVGGEDYGFGHVGTGDTGQGSDCWGCHGYDASANFETSGFGPITPYIKDASQMVTVTGTDTSITLNGASLTNYSGTTKFEAIFTLTSQDGTVIVLTPEQLTNNSATLIIPGTTPAGNYKLRAVKGSVFTWVSSNPVSISIKEPPVIWVQSVSQSCGECSGELTVWGTGFSIAPEGSEASINVMQNGVPLDITSWKGTLIKATGAVCDGSEITVNGLFGSATK